MCRQGSDGGGVLEWSSEGGVLRGQMEDRKRRQAGRTPNASRICSSGVLGREAFGVRPARRRFPTTPRVTSPRHRSTPFLSLLLFLFFALGFSQRAAAQPLIGKILVTNIG